MKRISFIILSFSFLILLSGCGLYKNYERPQDIAVEGIYGSAQSGDSLGLGDLGWREIFTDPLLQEIIERGLAQNANMRQADLRIQEAQNNLRAAKLAFFPSISIAPQGTISGIWDPSNREEYKGVMGNGATKTYAIPVAANWQADCFGQLRNAKKGSEVAVENMQTVRQAVQTAVVANIANLYYTLCMLDEQLRIAEETSENWKQNLEVTKLLMQAGQSNKAAVSSTEANYWSIMGTIVEIRNQIVLTENALANLLGETPHPFKRKTLESFQMPNACVTGVPISILSRRPDVRQAELALASSFYTKNQVRASFYPALNISASGQYTNSLGSMVINPGGIIAALVGTLTQPLFAQGKLRAAYKNALAEQEVAKIGFQQKILDAGNEVCSAMANIQVYKAEQEYIDKQVQSMQDAVEATQALMKYSNQVNYLNVLTAQSGLLQAQISQLTNKYNVISGVISLYQALGGGAE
ncbi:MAG: TolC family protein [Bacteroidaceae bacterium]|nr:TolC family protein [Bacteroidaceae bacterium]